MTLDGAARVGALGTEGALGCRALSSLSIVETVGAETPSLVDARIVGNEVDGGVTESPGEVRGNVRTDAAGKGGEGSKVPLTLS